MEIKLIVFMMIYQFLKTKSFQNVKTEIYFIIFLPFYLRFPHLKDIIYGKVYKYFRLLTQRFVEPQME